MVWARSGSATTAKDGSAPGLGPVPSVIAPLASPPLRQVLQCPGSRPDIYRNAATADPDGSSETGTVSDILDEAELIAAWCWEADDRVPRNLEVAERSGAFIRPVVDPGARSELTVMWLEHLLARPAPPPPSATATGWADGHPLTFRRRPVETATLPVHPQGSRWMGRHEPSG